MTETISHTCAILNGDIVNRIALGTWRVEHMAGEDFFALLQAGREAGLDVLDTAPVYGFAQGQGLGFVENMIGAAFDRDPTLRTHYKVVTKAGIIPPLPYDSRAAHLIDSAEASIARMGVDALDLFLIHRPDNLTPWAEVARGLNTLHSQGKIRAAGVSNFSMAQFEALQSALEFPLTATQPEISLGAIGALFDGQLDHAQQNGLIPMAWSPLGGLAGDVEGAPAHHVQTTIDEMATKYATDRANILLAWLMEHPARIMPILGTTRPGRVSRAAQAGEIRLERRDWYTLLEAARGAPMP